MAAYHYFPLIFFALIFGFSIYYNSALSCWDGSLPNLQPKVQIAAPNDRVCDPDTEHVCYNTTCFIGFVPFNVFGCEADANRTEEIRDWIRSKVDPGLQEGVKCGHFMFCPDDQCNHAINPNHTKKDNNNLA